jgi:hypothetical protein
MIKKLKITIFSVLLLFSMGCSNSNNTADLNASAPTITVRLVDAPGDYKAVNVEVVDVNIKMDNESDDESGWISLNAQNETINLLDFTGGVSKVLVDRFPIPAGTLTQMRLVLGDGNTIVIEEENETEVEYDLKTPSAQQSGLKLKTSALIEEGFTYDFVLDFDVEKSIVKAGNSGNIILKPVLYMSAEVNSGIIEGTVVPADVPSMVSVLVDDMDNDDPVDDFVISAYTNDSGAFALWGVPEGTYDVVVTPTDETSDYDVTTISGIVVTKGEITTISDPIELNLKPATINGTISGLADGVIATISINDTNSTTVATNASGEYTMEGIVPGDYIVTIGATGYVTQEFTITLEPAEVEVLDATLVLQ